MKGTKTMKYVECRFTQKELSHILESLDIMLNMFYVKNCRDEIQKTYNHVFRKLQYIERRNDNGNG